MSIYVQGKDVVVEPKRPSVPLPPIPKPLQVRSPHIPRYSLVYGRVHVEGRVEPLICLSFSLLSRSPLSLSLSSLSCLFLFRSALGAAPANPEAPPGTATPRPPPSLPPCCLQKAKPS